MRVNSLESGSGLDKGTGGVCEGGWYRAVEGPDTAAMR